MSRRVVTEQQVKTNIKGLVISSAKGLTVAQLARDYRECIGQEIPYSALGYRNLLDFLHTIPDTIQLHGGGMTALVVPVADEKLIHLEKMVQAQRKDTGKRSRRSFKSRTLRRPQAIITSSQGSYATSNGSPKTNSYQDYNRSQKYSEQDDYSSDEWEEPDYHPPPPTNHSNDLKKSIKLTNTSMNEPISNLNTRQHTSSLQNRLIALIEDYPDGIWCSELPTLYKQKFKQELDINAKGYLSVIHFCSAYKDIFKFEQPSNGDWKVYDSRKVLTPKNVNYSEYMFGAQSSPKENSMEEKGAMSALPDDLEEIFEPVYEPEPPSDVVQIGEKLPNQWLDIPKDNGITVRVTEIYDPSKFWIQLYTKDCSAALDELMNTMQNIYLQIDSSYDVPLSKVQVGLYVVALIYNEWHRGQVVKIEDATCCRVLFFDYGTISKIKSNALKYLLKEFALLPRQAIRARLANIRPKLPKLAWTVKASTYFLELVSNKVLFAEIINPERIKDRTLELILTDTSDPMRDVHINDMIKKRHLAAIVKDETQMIVPSSGPIDELSYFLYPLHEHLEEAKCPSYGEVILMCSNGIDRDLLTKTFITSLNRDKPAIKNTFIHNDFHNTTFNDTFSEIGFNDAVSEIAFNDTATEYSTFTGAASTFMTSRSSRSSPDKSWIESYDYEDSISTKPVSPTLPEIIEEMPILKPVTPTLPEIIEEMPVLKLKKPEKVEVSNSVNFVNAPVTHITTTETIMQPSINVRISAPPGFSPNQSVYTNHPVPQFQNPDPLSMLLASNFIVRNAMAMLPPPNNFYPTPFMQPYPPPYYPPQRMPFPEYPGYGGPPPQMRRQSKKKDKKVDKNLEQMNDKLNKLSMNLEQIGNLVKNSVETKVEELPKIDVNVIGRKDEISDLPKKEVERKVDKNLDEVNEKLNKLSMNLEQIGNFVKNSVETNVLVELPKIVDRKEEILELPKEVERKDEIPEVRSKKEISELPKKDVAVTKDVIPKSPKKKKQNSVVTLPPKQNKSQKPSNTAGVSTQKLTKNVDKPVKASDNQKVEKNPVITPKVTNVNEDAKKIKSAKTPEIDNKKGEENPAITPKITKVNEDVKKVKPVKVSDNKKVEENPAITPKVTNVENNSVKASESDKVEESSATTSKIPQNKKKKLNKTDLKITEKEIKNNINCAVETHIKTQIKEDTEVSKPVQKIELPIGKEGKVVEKELGSKLVHVVKVENELYLSILEFLVVYTQCGDVDKVAKMFSSEKIEFPVVNFDLAEYNSIYQDLIRFNVPGSSTANKSIQLLKFEDVPFMLEKLFAKNATLIKDMFKFTMEEAKSSV